MNNTQPQHQIDLERASAEVNRAKNQYRGKFIAKAGIFATWYLEDGTGVNIHLFHYKSLNLCVGNQSRKVRKVDL